jgi:hypothetical protein
MVAAVAVAHTSAAAVECVAVAGHISAGGCAAAAVRILAVVAESGTSAVVVVSDTSAAVVVCGTSAVAACGTLAAGPQAPGPAHEQFLLAAAERHSAPTAATGRLAAIATQICDPAPYTAR